MTPRSRCYCVAAVAVALLALLASGCAAESGRPDEAALEAELMAATTPGLGVISRRELLQLTSWVQGGDGNFANHDFGTVSGGNENRANGASPAMSPPPTGQRHARVFGTPQAGRQPERTAGPAP